MNGRGGAGGGWGGGLGGGRSLGRLGGERRGGRPHVRRDPRHAVVFSAGGAKGAYAVGVLRAILTGASGTADGALEPAIYTGSSVGGYCAAVLCSRSEDSPLAALDRLEEIWRRDIANDEMSCGNGVYRLRGLPVQEISLGCLMRPVPSFLDLVGDAAELSAAAAYRGRRFAASELPLPARLLESVDIAALFDASPMRRLVERTVDLDGLARSSHRLEVVASRWDTGMPRVFTRQDVVRLGHGPILASTAIPGIFHPVEVEGSPYVDGAMTMATPLRPAIRAGADVIHAIYLDPLLSNAPVPRNPNTFDVINRVFAILGAQRMNEDVRKARSVNRGLTALAGRLPADDTEAVATLGQAHETMRRRRRGGRRHRHLTIHRYRPLGELGNGADILNFDLRQVDRLIERGYADAAAHDCDESGCVRPGETADGAARGDNGWSGDDIRSRGRRPW